MILTHDEILWILRLIRDKYGSGYSREDDVAKIQGKLSIMLEAAARVEAARANR